MSEKRKYPKVGAKTGGEKKREKVRKNNGWARKLQSRLNEPEANETSEPTPFRQPPSYAVQDIEIADITVGRDRRALKEATVKELMESIPRLGLREPITVRPGVWGNLDWMSDVRPNSLENCNFLASRTVAMPPKATVCCVAAK
jgi:hypothetical protein